MAIKIGQFNNIDATSSYSHLANKNVLMVGKGTYMVQDTPINLNSNQIVELANNNLLLLKRNIPELTLSMAESLPNSVYVDLIEEALREAKIRENRRIQNQLNNPVIVEKDSFTLSMSIKLFIFNSFLPGMGYLLTKKYSLFMLYILNILILSFVFWSIFANSMVILIVVSLINYIFSINLYYSRLYLEKFGVHKNVGQNHTVATLILLPISFIVLQILNFIFFKGFVFSETHTWIFKYVNKFLPIIYSWLLNTSFMGTTLTSLMVYSIIYIFLVLITFAILYLFKKHIMRGLER